MSTYRAPLAEMEFVMNELGGLAQVAALPGFEDATPETASAILEEASKFATNVLDPLNVPGDRQVFGVLALGYPAEKPVTETMTNSVKYWLDERNVLHVPKRPFTEIVHYENFSGS